MKFKVFSYFVSFGNEKYDILTNLAKELNQKYCQMHGYEYQFYDVDKQWIIDEYGEVNYRTMVEYKNKFIGDVLKSTDADYIVFLDTDAAISNPNIKFEDLIDDTHSFFLSRGNDMWYQIWAFSEMNKAIVQAFQSNKIYTEYFDHTIMKEFNLWHFFEALSICYLGFNEGFYIIKNNDIMKEFFTECYELEQKYVKNLAFHSDSALDGRSIRYTICQEKYQNIFIHMDDITNGKIIAQGGTVNTGPTHYDVDKSFVLHDYGDATTTDQKIENIKRLKTNKWWGPHFNLPTPPIVQYTGMKKD